MIQNLPFIFKVPTHITPNHIYLIGRQYHYGDTKPLNKFEAMKYYKLSALLNDISGMKAYSEALKEGFAGIQNVIEANRYEQIYLIAIKSNQTIQDQNVQLRNQVFNLTTQLQSYQSIINQLNGQIQNLTNQNQLLSVQLSSAQQEIKKC
jgi:predicted  nucleic acid-binding Zn-ribbon protein